MMIMIIVTMMMITMMNMVSDVWSAALPPGRTL